MPRLTAVGAVLIIAIATIMIIAGFKGTYKAFWDDIWRAASLTPSGGQGSERRRI